MHISHININTDNNNHVIEFEKVNYLSEKDIITTLSTLSVFTYFFGTGKINKEVKSYFDENFIADIEVNINDKIMKWSRKYYHHNGTFALQKAKELNKLLKDLEQNKRIYGEDNVTPFFYFHKNTLNYEDDDFTEGDKIDYPYYLFSSDKVFFKYFLDTYFIARQNGNDDSKFHPAIVKFLAKFHFKSFQKIKDINYKIINESGSVSLFNPYMEFAFYVNDDKQNMIYLRDMDLEDLSFLRLLCEVFTRLDRLHWVKDQKNNEDYVYEIKGTFFTIEHIDNFYMEQLMKVLKNVQFFLLNNEKEKTRG